jgi:hypothetical protein
MHNLNAAFDAFLQETHGSLASHAIVEQLKRSDAADKYGRGSRNEIVQALAADVEQQIGCTASMIFRSTGFMYDALQELIDAFLDFVDGVDRDESKCAA